MASIILRSVGAAAGNALIPGIGGAFFGVLGRSLGGAIDGQLGLGTHITGPRLENLSVQDSRYGASIPTIYGNARVAGNVIWSTDLIEAKHTSNVGGGKGGGSATATTYTYSLHCAVGIAAGPIGGIATIWADSTVIYQSGSWLAGTVDSASFYLGSTSQSPDPLMQSILGAVNVPAYRGLAYVVFDNLQLKNFGDRLPNLTFEIIPPTTTSNPTWLGGTDAGLDVNAQAIGNGNISPIVLSGTASNVYRVLTGCFINPGSACQFATAEFDVTGDTPEQTASAQSASFTSDSVPTDCGWAMAPDGRFVVLFMQGLTAPTQRLVIYDSAARSFGPVFSASLGTMSPLPPRQIAWIDAQHFIITDMQGTVRGVSVFARSGLSIVSLGFFGIWGSGSTATRFPLFYTQFLPYAGGLINIMTDAATGLTYFNNLYAVTLAWQNNALVVGAPYVIATGLASSGAGEHANIVQTGDGEWTLCLGTVTGFYLISFVLGSAAATITRPWQAITTSISVGWIQFPLFYGDRLVMLQANAFDNYFYLSEVLLNTGSFTLNVNAAQVGNYNLSTYAYGGLPLDQGRLLAFGVTGYNRDLGVFGIIERAAYGTGLDAIVGDILTRCGYASGDYDVTALSGTNLQGFVLSDPMSGRAAIEPLQIYLPFDLIESNAQLKAVLRHGTADVSIPSSEWRAAVEHKPQPPAIDTTRTQELDLPREIDVDFIDPARNFEINSQRARRTTSHAQAIQKINLPIVAPASTAKQIAETRLYTMWSERELYRLTMSRTWLQLDPGDVIDLNNGTLLRITNINHAGSLLTLEGFAVTSASGISNAVADGGVWSGTASVTPIPSTLYVLDLPLLQSTDDQPGVYLAATGNAGWVDATVLRSSDGVNYSNVTELDTYATTGIATTTLGIGSAFYIDNVNSVSVQILNGTLSSCTMSDLLNGANPALLGSEIIQFQTATLTAPGLYILSGLVRGRRGTESAITTHVTGENFVLLQTGAVDFAPTTLSDRGGSYLFRALSKGQSLNNAMDVGFTYGLATIEPFAPANITGTRASGTGSDLTLVWKRRARLNAEWVSYVDVPLDEPTELYDIEIMNGAVVTRTFFAVTAPTVTYTAAMQSADWGGSIPTTYSVNIYQISSRYGRGKQANAFI